MNSHHWETQSQTMALNNEHTLATSPDSFAAPPCFTQLPPLFLNLKFQSIIGLLICSGIGTKQHVTGHSSCFQEIPFENCIALWVALSMLEFEQVKVRTVYLPKTKTNLFEVADLDNTENVHNLYVAL